MSRQATAGADEGFDGAFAFGGRFHIVEVKYSIHRIDAGSIRRALSRIVEVVLSYGWRNVQIVLVLAYEGEQAPQVSDVEILGIAADFNVPVLVRQYSVDELERLLGVINEND